MDWSIPTPEEVAAALAPLSYSQVQELSRLSGVPLTTLWKVKTGETKDPGLSKVQAFMPHVAAAAAFPGKVNADQRAVSEAAETEKPAASDEPRSNDHRSGSDRREQPLSPPQLRADDAPVDLRHEQRRKSDRAGREG